MAFKEGEKRPYYSCEVELCDFYTHNPGEVKDHLVNVHNADEDKAEKTAEEFRNFLIETVERWERKGKIGSEEAKSIADGGTKEFEEKFDEALEEAYEGSEAVELHPVIDFNSDIGTSIGISLPIEGQDKETIITEESLFARNNSVKLLKGVESNRPITIKSGNSSFVSEFTYRNILSLVVEARKNGQIKKEGKSGDIFEEVLRKVGYYWWHRDERWRLALTCWIVGTYFFVLYPAYPIWIAQGERETGKTTSLKVVRLLAWNPTNVETNLRPAPLYRTIEGARPTYIVDVTKLPKQQKVELQDVAESGFEKDGSVRRCVGDDNEPVDFNTYCPKAMATRQDLPFDAKAVKCITRMPESGEARKKYTQRWTELREDPDRKKLVRNLLKLALSDWDRVIEAYDSLEQTEDLVGRRFTIWRPLFSICKAFAPGKLDELRELAVEDAQKMEATDFTYDVENAVLGYLIAHSKGGGNSFSVFLTGSNSITEGVRDIMGQENIPWQTVRSAVNNLGIAKRGFDTSSGKKYQIDIGELEKRVEARDIHEDTFEGEPDSLLEDILQDHLDFNGSKAEFIRETATRYDISKTNAENYVEILEEKEGVTFAPSLEDLGGDAY